MKEIQGNAQDPNEVDGKNPGAREEKEDRRSAKVAK